MDHTQCCTYLFPFLHRYVYEGEWFYVWNLERSAPAFIGCIPMAQSHWTYCAEKKFRLKIDYMLAVIAKQCGWGLTGERLVRIVMQCCLQLLAGHQRTMWQFIGAGDSDCHSAVILIKEEVVAHVLAVTPNVM